MRFSRSDVINNHRRWWSNSNTARIRVYRYIFAAFPNALQFDLFLREDCNEIIVEQVREFTNYNTILQTSA